MYFVIMNLISKVGGLGLLKGSTRFRVENGVCLLMLRCTVGGLGLLTRVY